MTPTTEQLKDLLDKVTKGRWTHETGPAFKGEYHAIMDGDGELIADCWEKDDEQSAQDATLIALAPTLAAEVVRLRERLAIAEISVEGMSEIKAISDGDTTNTIQDVVDWVLSRIARQAVDATSEK